MPDRMTPRGRDRVVGLLGGLVGQTCWSAIVGPRGDYVLSLELGEKKRRSLRLANPRLSFLQRTFEGEHSLLIECPWRLDGPGGVVIPSFALLDPGFDEPPTELGEIVDRRVEAVAAEGAGFDLTIRMSGGFVLRALSVEAGGRGKKAKRNNWAYWSPAGLITIGPRGHVIDQSRAEAEAGFRRLARVLTEDDDDDHPRMR